ncbi:MAG TPA: hypothetical protein PLA50_00790 [Bacteroidia bacterium]|nr:hypothetical protein [Bacteroidia bacterium]
MAASKCVFPPVSIRIRNCVRKIVIFPRGKTGERGDFYMTLRVAVPEKVRVEETAAWEKLREVSKFPSRDASHA